MIGPPSEAVGYVERPESLTCGKYSRYCPLEAIEGALATDVELVRANTGRGPASSFLVSNCMPNSPWNAFEPLLVIACTTPPVAPPNSASKPLLLIWISWTAWYGISLL